MEPGLPSGGRARLDLGTRRSRIGHGVDSDDDGLTILSTDDLPEASPPANRLADRGGRTLREGIQFEVTVGVANFEDPPWHERRMPDQRAAKPS